MFSQLLSSGRSWIDRIQPRLRKRSPDLNLFPDCFEETVEHVVYISRAAIVIFKYSAYLPMYMQPYGVIAPFPNPLNPPVAHLVYYDSKFLPCSGHGLWMVPVTTLVPNHVKFVARTLLVQV